MSESLAVKLNPANISFERLKRDVGDEIEVRTIGAGGKQPNLNLVFEQSLLGYRLSGGNVDEAVLSGFEKELHKLKELKIQTIVDFDGVLVSPIHLQRSAGVKNMLWLARVAKASDKTVIWTNRLQPDQGASSNYGWFPFLGKKVSQRITDALKNQGEVEIKKKKINGNGSLLAEMAEESDLTIFIGSGNIDRSIISEYAKNGGDPKKLIYFDTGHLLL